MTDFELLAQHRTQQHGDGPFAELVRRNVGWVHGAARRRLRDSHLADDVSQAVFFLLHRKAPEFTSDRALIAWLHRTTWYASEVAARQQRRRWQHETEAAMLRLENPQPDREWDELAPLLDQLIERLGRRDREAVLLRYYRQMGFAQVAAATGTTEEAARKRVGRALDKLRSWASSKGTPVSAAALTLGLESAVGASPPAGLVASTTSTALAGNGSAITSTSIPIAKGAMTMMTVAKAKIAAAVLVSTMIVTGGTAVLVAGTTSTPATPGASTQPVEPAKDNDTKLAPYDGIRWTGNAPQIHVNGRWYDWLALDGVETPEIVDFAKKTYNEREFKRRIGEDLVEVLTRMGHAPGKSVNLKLREPESGLTTNLKDVVMTHWNRQEVWKARQAEEKK